MTQGGEPKPWRRLQTIDVTVNDVTRPFKYRPGTSDETVVIPQIFRDEDYKLSRLSRAPDFREYIRRRAALGLRPLIIDAGANIGASAIYFSVTVPEAKVIAIEPEAWNYELCRENTEGLDVVGIRGALASKPGSAVICNEVGVHTGFRAEWVEGDASPGQVACVSVNELFERYNTGFFPFIVKIDIEGAEKDVFSANTEWVKKTPLLIIELHDWLLPKRGTAQPFLRCIAAQDRDFVHIGENIFSVSNELESMAT